MSTFRIIIDKISKVSFVLSEVVMFLLAVIIFYNVIMRYIFRMPTSWSTEVSAYMLVAITFLSIPEIANQKGHIKFTLFVSHLPLRKHYLTEIITTLVGLFFCSILVWQGSRVTYMAYAQHMCSSSLLKMPLFVPYSLLPLGATSLFLVLLVRIVEDIQHLSKGGTNE